MLLLLFSSIILVQPKFLLWLDRRDSMPLAGDRIRSIIVFILLVTMTVLQLQY